MHPQRPRTRPRVVSQATTDGGLNASHHVRRSRAGAESLHRRHWRAASEIRSRHRPTGATHRSSHSLSLAPFWGSSFRHSRAIKGGRPRPPVDPARHRHRGVPCNKQERFRQALGASAWALPIHAPAVRSSRARRRRRRRHRELRHVHQPPPAILGSGPIRWVYEHSFCRPPALSMSCSFPYLGHLRARCRALHCEHDGSALTLVALSLSLALCLDFTGPAGSAAARVPRAALAHAAGAAILPRGHAA